MPLDIPLDEGIFFSVVNANAGDPATRQLLEVAQPNTHPAFYSPSFSVDPSFQPRLRAVDTLPIVLHKSTDRVPTLLRDVKADPSKFNTEVSAELRTSYFEPFYAPEKVPQFGRYDCCRGLTFPRGRAFALGAYRGRSLFSSLPMAVNSLLG